MLVRVLAGGTDAAGHDEGVALRPMERRLLAALAVCRPASVSIDSLMEALWVDDAPPSARKTIQTLVFRLRTKLGSDVVETIGDRYRLGRDVVTDIDEFERCVEAASESGASSVNWDVALHWCHDSSLDDLRHWSPADGIRSRLCELRAVAIEARWEALLAEGDASALLPALEALVSEDPLRERRWAALLRGYQRAGRRAEGLRAFERARRTLALELGVTPGVELVEAYESLLREDLPPNDHPDAPGTASVASHMSASDARHKDGVAAAASGDWARAVELFSAAAAHAREADDPRRFAEAALGAAGDGWRTSQDATQPVISLLGEALQRVPVGPTPMRSRLLARYAIVCSHHVPVAQSAPIAYKALAIARAIAQTSVIAEALFALSVVVWDPTQRDTHWAWVDELGVLADQHPEQPWRRWVLPITARLRTADGDVRGAGRDLDRLAAEASDAGDAHGQYGAAHRGVLRATVTGDWAAARAAAAAIRAAGEGASFDPAGMALQQRGMLGIIDLLSEPANVPPLPTIEWPLDSMRLSATAWRANGLARSGRTMDAKEVLASIDPASVAEAERDGYWLATLSMLADAAYLTGCRPISDVVAASLEPVLSLTIADPGLCYRGSAAHAAGLAAATCGRRRQAVDLLSAGLATHLAHGSTWMAERSQQVSDRLAAP